MTDFRTIKGTVKEVVAELRKKDARYATKQVIKRLREIQGEGESSE